MKVVNFVSMRAFSFHSALVIFCLQFTSIAIAQDKPQSSRLPDIIVSAEDSLSAPQRTSTIDKVDVLRKDRIEKSQATTLNEAVDRMPGIDSQDYCVNCGAKRISINGLRGDHTSVLVDGMPLYSAVSSVYGFDAIPMQSVEEIEVRRGTGSALIDPEAIGGSINILTINPKETGSRASVFAGDRQTRTYELLHSHVFEKYKVSVGVEHNKQEFWDVDNNGFAESPYKGRTSAFIKQIFDLSSKTQWATRLSHADVEIIGGNTQGYRLTSPSSVQASDTDFENGDVRRRYLGGAEKISEYVQVQRSEATSKVSTIVDGDNSIEWNLGGAIYRQKSVYMHGFDYNTVNSTAYTDLRWSHALSSNQMILLGSSFRYESLRSGSKIMYDQNGIKKDDFDYRAYSLFAQHDWALPHGIDLSTSVRLEKLENKWRELGALNRNVVSPRALLKWEHTEHLSQQLAYGQGYRMPLTSIESAHGAYDGFKVDITELERSQSLRYSISYNTPTHYLTPSVHYTRLENMSYPLDPEVPHSGPLRFVNDTEIHDIYVYDVLAGVRPLSGWLLELGYEVFRYNDGYKSKLPTAAIEQRVSVRSEYEKNDYTFILNGTWIGSRNIGRYYQYPDRYNVSDGLLGVSDQKRQEAPSYWQWDVSVSKKIKSFEATVGVQNLLGYTQTGDGDSPAMWHLHGNHTHLDNRHVWGPNRGREAYMKIAYNF